MKKLFLLLVGLATGLTAGGQPAKVVKTNSLPVYAHYMPWFETPQSTGGPWGWHWAMNTRNPNVLDPATGQRQIAAHFYPLIGPYASSDPDVIEYHLLLMKLAGIDGVLLDWYGTAGTNGDVGSMLRNSNALIDRTDETGLQFGLILEDRYAASAADTRANLAYAKDHYFNRPQYIRYGPGQAPLLGVFGPITFTQPSQWAAILPAAGEDLEFLTLWDNELAGANADGQYVWPFEDGQLNNYYSYLEEYYRYRAPAKKTVMGVAYPGFQDFYAQGINGAQTLFVIPHKGAQTLSQLLGLADQYRTTIDLLQLATWNDFGEGTMLEPTQEFGFSFLTRIQQYTGVPYTERDLRQVYRLYQLRKKFAGDAARQGQLDRAFDQFVALRLPAAVALLDAVASSAPPVTVYKDIAYGGYAVDLPVGSYPLAALLARGIADHDITSLQVGAGYQVTLYDQADLSGASLTKTADDASLVNDGWNDRAASLVVSAASAPLALAPADPAAPGQLLVYPNPATNRLTLRAARSLVGSHFQILDARGRLVASGGADPGSVDVATLRPGLYTLLLTTANNEQLRQRFTK